MSQDHYLPLFVGDFLASTATWTGPERGLYLQLLAFQWASGSLPCDLERLALALHYQPKEFKKLWPTMASKFETGNGRMSNARLEAIRAKNAEVHASRSAKATAAAHARWNAPSISGADAEHNQEQYPAMPSDPIRTKNINPNASSYVTTRAGIPETLKSLAESKRMPR